MWDGEMVGSDQPVGMGIVHLSQIDGHWREPSWLNLYGFVDDLGDGIAAKVLDTIMSPLQSKSDRRFKDDKRLMKQGHLPGTAYVGRIKISLKVEDHVPSSVLTCCADGGSDLPAAAAAAPSEEGETHSVGYRFRSLVLQAGSLPHDGRYCVRLSCGDEVVESARLPSSGGCVNWWESCGAGQGVELPPLDFRRLSHHDISQVPDVFANMYCGAKRLGFVRLDPQSLHSGEEFAIEIAEWHTLLRDPAGPVAAGQPAGSILLAVSVEPLFARGSRIGGVGSVVDAGHGHRKRKATAPRPRSDSSRTARRELEEEEEGVEEARTAEEIERDRRQLVRLERELRDKKRTLRMLEAQATTQLMVTVVEAHDVKDPAMFGSAAGQYFAEVEVGAAGSGDRTLKRRTKPSGNRGADPYWNQSLPFDVTQAVSSTLTVHIFSNGLSKQARPIGSTEELELRSVVRKRQVEGWFPLDDGQRGEVFLSVSANVADDQGVAEEVVDSHRTKLRRLEEDYKELRSRLRNTAGVIAPPSSHNWSIGGGGAAAPKLSRYMLHVHIYQARNVPPVDKDGAAHTFVRVDVGEQWQRTSTHHASLSPRWYETVFFELHLPQENDLMRLWAPQLVMSLFHSPDSVLSTSQELLGRLQLQLDPESADLGALEKEPTWQTFSMANADTGETRTASADVLIAYELVPATSTARTKKRQKEKIVELDFKKHRVSMMLIGCRGLQPVSSSWLSTPVPELELTIPSVDPSDDDLVQATVQPTLGDRDLSDPQNPNYCLCSEERGEEIPGQIHLDAVLPNQLYCPVLLASVSTAALGRNVHVGTATINLATFMDESFLRERKRKRSSLRRSRNRLAARSAVRAEHAVGRHSVPRLESALVDVEYGSVPRDSMSGLLDQSIGMSRSDAVFDSSSSESDYGSDSDTEDTPVDSDEAGVAAGWNWLQKREVLTTGLEAWLPPSDVLSFPLYRRAALDKHHTDVDAAAEASCGVLKAAIVPTQGMSTRRTQAIFRRVQKKYGGKPEKVTAFVYVVRAMHLAQDGSGDGKCDARLHVSLQGPAGEIDPVDKPVCSTDDTLNPYFGQLYKVETELPGAARLSIALYDHKDLAEKASGHLRSEQIGATVLDLEDRYFSATWRRECIRRGGKGRHAPVERRTLRREGFSLPCGQVELWVDIFRTSDVNAGKSGQLEPAQYRAFRREPELFELRVAILNARRMHTMDGEQNDLKISAELVTLKADATAHSTDTKTTTTHQRAETGGSFNEWLAFKNVELYHPIPTQDVPIKQRQRQRLLLKAWDSDMFTASDLIGSYDSAAVSESESHPLFDVDALFERAMVEVSKVKQASGGRKERKFNRQHVFRLPDSSVGGGSTASRLVSRGKSCCPCFRRGPTRPRPEPAYAPFSKALGQTGDALGFGSTTARGEVEMHIELLPKQLAESVRLTAHAALAAADSHLLQPGEV